VKLHVPLLPLEELLDEDDEEELDEDEDPEDEEPDEDDELDVVPEEDDEELDVPVGVEVVAPAPLPPSPPTPPAPPKLVSSVLPWAQAARAVAVPTERST
jgi:hypothetical protein